LSTYFIKDKYFTTNKWGIDKTWKDKKHKIVAKDFKIELFFDIVKEKFENIPNFDLLDYEKKHRRSSIDLKLSELFYDKKFEKEKIDKKTKIKNKDKLKDSLKEIDDSGEDTDTEDEEVRKEKKEEDVKVVRKKVSYNIIDKLLLKKMIDDDSEI
jgi:hypothetical protein